MLYNHEKGITDLEAEGRTRPCVVETANGKEKFKSHWMATNWLKANGYYEDGAPWSHIYQL